MSDPNKFINTYIDTAIATLHEYMGSSLQLKTQLKIANDLLAERDGVIAQITSELENFKNNHTENQENNNSLHAELMSCRDRLTIAEDSHNALKVKTSHMDTLLNQISDMKHEIISRDNQIASLNNDLATKDTQISSLNNDLATKDTQISSLNNDLATKDTQISSYGEKYNNLSSVLNDKDKLISELTEKSTQAIPTPLPISKAVVGKNVKESSTVKVQLNTKIKTKEPNDDF